MLIFVSPCKYQQNLNSNHSFIFIQLDFLKKFVKNAERIQIGYIFATDKVIIIINTRTMKKLLLLTFTIVFVTFLSAGAVNVHYEFTNNQYLSETDTLELYDTLGHKINNGKITVTATNPSVDVIAGHIWIKNTTSTTMNDVYVRRIINYEVPGTMNSFCFGVNCYGPMTNVSTIPTVIGAGVLDKSFYGDYYPDAHMGTTSITYEFFDNTTFSKPVLAKATIDYRLSLVGVNDNKLVFKGPYPNPSSQQANFEYNLPNGNENAQLVIRNTLGVEVASYTIENQSGKKSIDVSEFASGIYFYTFIVDGKVIQSKKMIIKH